jgi:hypothetical protein
MGLALYPGLEFGPHSRRDFIDAEMLAYPIPYIASRLTANTPSGVTLLEKV